MMPGLVAFAERGHVGWADGAAARVAAVKVIA